MLALAPLATTATGSTLDVAVQPHLMLIGAQKAATTAVFDLLSSEVGVCGAKDATTPLNKEAHFFDKGVHNKFNRSAIHDYQEQYTQAGCSRYIDATPNYLLDYKASQHMAYMPPQWKETVKIVAILREPISRDLSMFNMVKFTWKTRGVVATTEAFGNIQDQFCERPSQTFFPQYGQTIDCQMKRFSTCKAAHPGDLNSAWAHCAENCAPLDQPCAPTTPSRLANGMYAPQLQQYFNLFGKNRVLVVNFDFLISKTSAAMHEIVQHYGLQGHAKKQLDKLPEENSSDFPGKVLAITCATRNKLEAFYQPFQARLVKLIGAEKASFQRIKCMHSHQESTVSEESTAVQDAKPLLKGERVSSSLIA